MSSLKLLGSEVIHDSVLSDRSGTTTPTNEEDLSYNFINKDFLNDINRLGSHPMADLTVFKSCRNRTSTPTHLSYPLSLPKSLPIDWDLFDEQYRLQQKLERFRARKRRRLELPNRLIDDLPFEIMNFITGCIDSQNDLISLSQTCKKFNRFVNEKLYSNILIIDRYENKLSLKNYDSKNLTILNMKNYPKFLATLHSNDFNLHLIKTIIIGTSTPDFVNENENVYQPLYDIFMAKDNNLKTFQNYDIKNLKKFGSILNYNKQHLVKYNFKKYNFYNLIEDEDDDCQGVNVDEMIEKDLLNLQNTAVLDLNELKVLPHSVVSLVVLIENEYKLQREKFTMTQRIFNKFDNLKSLHLSNTLSLTNLIKEFAPATTNSWFHRLQLESLSISNIHKNYMTPSVPYNQLNKIIDIPNLTNFEFKTNCLAKQVCDSCIIKFFNDWYHDIRNTKTNNLKKLSIIEVNSTLSGENTLTNNQWDYLFINEWEKLSVIFQNLDSITLSLNDFPLIPSRPEAPLVNNSNHILADDMSIQIRSKMYENFFRALNPDKLQELNIADYLFSWLPFSSKKWFGDNGVMRYTSFCDCQDCSNPGPISSQISTPEDLHNFNDLFIRELFTRSTLVNNVTSTLNSFDYLQTLNFLNKFPINFKDVKMDEEHFNLILKGLFHSMVKNGVVNDIIAKLPKLVKLNLGGLRLKLFKMNTRKLVTIHPLFNEFDDEILGL